ITGSTRRASTRRSFPSVPFTAVRMVRAFRAGQRDAPLRLALPGDRVVSSARPGPDRRSGADRRSASPRFGTAAATGKATGARCPAVARGRPFRDGCLGGPSVLLGSRQVLLQRRVLDEDDLPAPRNPLYVYRAPLGDRGRSGADAAIVE